MVFAESNQYSLFQNYRPEYIEWNENLIFLKCRTPVLNKMQKELVVAYNRLDMNNDQISYGLLVSQYFQFTDGYTKLDTTPSIPFLYVDQNNVHQVRFTQSQIQPAAGKYNPLTVAYALSDDPSFKLKITNKITKSQAGNIKINFTQTTPVSTLKLDQIFTAFSPDPNNSGGEKKSGPGWYFWVILGLFIIVLLLYIREKVAHSTPQVDEKNDDSAYNKSLGTGKDDEYEDGFAKA